MFWNEGDRKKERRKKGTEKGDRLLFLKKVACPLFLIEWIFFGK